MGRRGDNPPGLCTLWVDAVVDGNRCWWVVALVAFGCVACTEAASSDPSGADSADVGSDASDHETGGGDAGDGDSGDAGWTLELRAIDDLGPTPSPAGVDAALTRADGGTWSATVELPPGLWSWRLLRGTEARAPGDDGLAGPPSEASLRADGAPGRFFLADDATLTVTTDLTQAHFERVESTSSLPHLDAPGTAVDIGPVVDAALASAPRGLDDGQVLGLMQAIFDAGGGPVDTSRGRLFVGIGTDGEPAPEIRGSFTGWSESAEAELRPLSGRLWARFVEVPAGPQAYKLVYGDGAAWFTDPSNRHIAWDGIATEGVGSFNSLIEPEPEPGGRMVWWPRFHSPQLGNDRSVYVHLPPSYDASSERRYPVLYVQDGNESIVRGQFHEAAAQWYAERPERELILVFVALPTQEVRMAEYTMGSEGALGDAYARFMAESVVPAVDAAFRTRGERGHRGLMGASLGGLISYWTALRYPDTFGFTAGMSSSFFWAEDFMLDQIREGGCRDLDYYLDSGSPEDNYAVTVAMRDTLASLGCRHRYVHDAGARHEWSFWRARLPGVLDAFAGVFEP